MEACGRSVISFTSPARPQTSRENLQCCAAWREPRAPPTGTFTAGPSEYRSHMLVNTEKSNCEDLKIFSFVVGRKPKTHQPTISNGSLDLGIKKKPREGKGIHQLKHLLVFSCVEL